MTTHKLDAQNVNVYYDQAHVIRDVSLTIEANTVTAFIGPSGCGKSTFLRLINRMNDYIDGFRKTGTILIDGEDIYDKKVRVEELRKKIGMVFQKPNPFPKSIYENVIYGLRIQGINKNRSLTRRWNGHCAAQPSGMKSKTISTNLLSRCPVASSSAYA